MLLSAALIMNIFRVAYGVFTLVRFLLTLVAVELDYLYAGIWCVQF